MAYTALEKMRQKNLERFGQDVGPMPPVMHGGESGDDLKSAALRFLHERCEALRFDAGIAAQEDESGSYQGAGVKAGQVPYDMQMDIDRLCLERELEKFIDSGVAEDAYTVYYCYLSMFFGAYGHSKKMVELLSEFESNGSSLLMKHRDHYSHSVYVFTLGLAIYETNENYRKTFQEFYRGEIEAAAEKGASDDGSTAAKAGADADAGTGAEVCGQSSFDRAAAHLFLEYWGLTSLFHDIGYPFELPFEQVLSYFEVDDKKRGKGRLFLSYRNLDRIMNLEEDEAKHFSELFDQEIRTVNELFAHGIVQRLGERYGLIEKELCRKIASKPVAPEEFNYYMDHAWFSAVRLYRELITAFGIEAIGRMHVDALTAILMHNSLYKFVIDDYQSDDRKGPLPMDLHPLAFLLMLCDELQCWDRIAYGRNSRTELHPMHAEFDFSGNAIQVVYDYDEEELGKIEEFRREHQDWKDGKLEGKDGEPAEEPRLKAYSDMDDEIMGRQRFTDDILKIVDTSRIPLTVATDTDEVDRSSKHTYLSDSNFLHLYDFAVALNARYAYQDKEDEAEQEQLEKEFEELSMEYQLSNINQAKSFARYLDVMGCFYTDRPVDYDMVSEFTPQYNLSIAPMEHERWIREHIEMGWQHGDFYKTVVLPKKEQPSGFSERVRSIFAEIAAAFGGGETASDQTQQIADEAAYRKALREQMRMHELAMDGDPSSAEIRVHFEDLPDTEKEKDWKPFNTMLKLIRLYDGLRIYRL